MSSPLFVSETSRRRARQAARRARRRRRRALAALVLTVLIAAILFVTLGAGNASKRPADRSRGHSGRTHLVARAARSVIGLPLGKPALTLGGVGDPSRDPVHEAFHNPPSAGILFNLSTGQVLWQRNPDERLRIASLTKMMTALITVKSAPSDAPVLVTRRAINMPGSKVGVLPLGKHVRLETLLYGLLLPSGNDAAVALAEHVAGSVGRFVQQMNIEAAKLGMGCTHYSSPSGYYDQYNFSCAADLAVLAHDDLEQPRIARVTRTYSAALPFPIKGGRLFLYNNNPLLIYGYPGLTGLKTGYTEAAGRCLVATATRDGVGLGVVLLHSPDPGTQAAYLLNRGFEGIYHQRPVPEPPIPAGA